MTAHNLAKSADQHGIIRFLESLNPASVKPVARAVGDDRPRSLGGSELADMIATGEVCFSTLLSELV